ncbi:MAG: immune inhibitor A [Longimicrobiales bacterium]|nr:immune inhibitor A [Longimicrobiales bacterium]
MSALPSVRASSAVLLGLSLICLVGSPHLVDAQDIEAAAARRGIQLPESYFQSIQQTPDLYEFERALFNRVTPDRTSSFGEVRLPVVLALFSDSPAQPHITREMVQASLFDGPSERGTITESYLEMSGDALTVTGDVYGWARSTLTMAQVVGTEQSLGADARVGQYIVEALTELDPSIDFAVYDNDGPDGLANSGDDDGFVDVITIEFLEIAASCGGPAIWPHRSGVRTSSGDPFETDDLGINGELILVLDYITQSASDCEGESVQDASVITHEFGHALGLPDWYHWIDFSAGPYGRRWVMGCWALMAAGSWGCGPVTDDREPFGPTHMLGYSKEFLGWTDYIEVGEVWNEEIELFPIETSGEVLRFQLDDAGDEFLIAEFRDLIGFDYQLPGTGVLLYKNDTNAERRPNPSTGDPYFLTMLEQDNNGSLLLMATEGGSRGEIGDAWGVGGVSNPLNAETAPALRLANNSWSTVQVHEVAVVGDRARLVISTGKTPRLIEPTDNFEVTEIKTFYAGVRIAGGRGPYQGVGDLPDGFVFVAKGDELFLAGSLREAGSFEYSFAVRDSGGNVSNEVTISVSVTGEWTVKVPDLFQQFLQSDRAGITPGEAAYLDEVGNANGQYDLGDLRKWLRENN